MRVAEILTLFPKAVEIFAEYGIHCAGCSIGGVEALEEGCRIHGFSDEMIEELLDDLNTALEEEPACNQTITITEDAAEGIAAIAKEEGHEGEVLRVVVAEDGGMALEFTEEPIEGEKEFWHDDHPKVKVCTNTLTLHRIGGATIDVREGRFKLDLPEDVCCGGEKEDCCQKKE